MPERGSIGQEHPFSPEGVREYSRQFASSYYDWSIRPAMPGTSHLTDLKSVQDRVVTLKHTSTQETRSTTAVPEVIALSGRAIELATGEKVTQSDMLAGYAMHEGNIAEVELDGNREASIAVAATLKAFAGEDVHVIEQSQQAAKDALLKMGSVYEAMGVRAAVLIEGKYYIYDSTAPTSDAGEHLLPVENLSDLPTVIYGAQNDFISQELNEKVATLQPGYKAPSKPRKLNAFVYNADTALIDQASAPIIKSLELQPDEEYLATLQQADQIAKQLVEDQTSETPHDLFRLQSDATQTFYLATLTPAGEKWIDGILKDSKIEPTPLLRQALFNSLQAHAVYTNTDKATIYTTTGGRIEPRFPGGIQEALEVKEHVAVTPIQRHQASISVQGYMRRYDSIGGISTAATPYTQELHDSYRVDTVQIPSSNAEGRFLEPKREQIDHLFAQAHVVDNGTKTERVEFDGETIYQGKIAGIVGTIEQMRSDQSTERERPIVICTSSPRETMDLMERLQSQGINPKVYMPGITPPDQLLRIVAQAGSPSTVTILQSVQGLDLPLPQTVEGKPLHVISTYRLSPAIDERIAKLAGPNGSVDFFIGATDRIFQAYFAWGEVPGKPNKSFNKILEILTTSSTSAEAAALAMRTIQTEFSAKSTQWRGMLAELDGVIQERWTEYQQRRQHIQEHPEIFQEEIKLRRTVVDTVTRQFTDALKTGDGETLSRLQKLVDLTGDEMTAYHNANQKGKIRIIREAVGKRIDKLAREHPEAQQQVLLNLIDQAWSEYLTDINQQNQVLWIRAQGQDIPLEKPKDLDTRLFDTKDRDVQETLALEILSISPDILNTGENPPELAEVLARRRLALQTTSSVRSAQNLWRRMGPKTRASIGMGIGLSAPSTATGIALLLAPEPLYTKILGALVLGIPIWRILAAAQTNKQEQQEERIATLRQQRPIY